MHKTHADSQTMKLVLTELRGAASAMESISSISTRWKLCILASLIGFIILIVWLNPAHNSTSFFDVRDRVPDQVQSLQALRSIANETQKEVKDEKEEKCNIFDGKWVYDPDASPLYNASQCPFLTEKVSCQRNGRPDAEYEKWSWEAKRCKIPRFNATDMLERLRGKRLILVGDSLNRNQFESLACLLYSAVPSSEAYVRVTKNEYKVFKAKAYNCTVEFYWSPFLVQLEVNKTSGSRVLRLDKLSTSARKWRGADIMVFNSGHWWMHVGKIRAWDEFRNKGKLMETLTVKSAFKIAMKTWRKWIDRNVDTTKTTVFVRSISQTHLGRERCHNKSQPIMDESYVAAFPRPLIDIVETIQDMRKRGMRTPTRFLNITKMSGHRIDAHPSVYRRKRGNLLPNEKGDCSHWCLPGVPDSWNKLLYASMVLKDLNTSEDFSVPSHSVATSIY